jgi:hypothetical protein
MKKLLLILILASPIMCQAQLWYIGGKAGASFANYKAKTPWKEASNTGFSFGATAFKQINSHSGLVFDLIYIQKGYNHKICNEIFDQLEASYLEVPIMFHCSFTARLEGSFECWCLRSVLAEWEIQDAGIYREQRRF